MKWMLRLLVLSLVLISPAGNAEEPKGSSIEKLSELRERYQLNSFTKETGFLDRLQNTIIVIGDIGFKGLDQEDAYVPKENLRALPVYPEKFMLKYPELGKFDEQLELTGSDHGRRMAQIVWNLTKVTLKGGRTVGPKIYCLNTRKLANFKSFVKFISDGIVEDGKPRTPDVVLFSNIWEVGNFGMSPDVFSKLVRQVTSKGTLWFNAAGNHRWKTHTAKVKVGDDGFVLLGRKNNETELKIKSRLDDNLVKVVLSWNRFSEDVNAGTIHDLDIHVYDENGIELKKLFNLKDVEMPADQTRYTQVLGPKKDVADHESYSPMEEVKFKAMALAEDQYYRVKIKVREGSTGKFGDNDRLKVVILPEKETYLDKQKGRELSTVRLVNYTTGEDVMTPATDSTTIAVSDTSFWSATGPVWDPAMDKPEIFVENSSLSYTDNESNVGTSNANAIIAAVAGVYRAHEPKLTREHFIKFVQSGLDYMKEQHHAVIVNRVAKLVGEDKLTPMLTFDGRMQLGIPVEPSTVRDLFPDASRNVAGEHEYYLSLKQDGERKIIARDTRKIGSKDPYPWEAQSEKPFSYLQVRKVPADLLDQLAVGTPLRKIFKAQTPAQLREAVKK